MSKLILYSLLLFSSLSVLAENFDPAACPDLTVKIYPGTGRWRVLHATSSAYFHSAYGYDFVGIHSSGKINKGMWRTRTLLRMDMALGKSSRLDFLMTTGQAPPYFLVTQSNFWYGPTTTVPLNVMDCSEGTICFTIPMESSDRKRLEAIRIDMKTNTAEYFLQPGKKLSVEWNKDGFEIAGLPGDEGKFEFVMPFSNYRGTDGGITSVRRKIGSRFLFFPVYQTFYLDSRDTAAKGE